MPDSVRAAQVFIENLIASDFAKAADNFDPSVRAAVNDQSLAQMWSHMTTLFGKALKHVGTRTAKSVTGANEIIYLSWDFEKERVDARIVVNAANKLLGIAFETPVIK
jgi:Protein of unknown function (DUF3887)